MCPKNKIVSLSDAAASIRREELQSDPPSPPHATYGRATFAGEFLSFVGRTLSLQSHPLTCADDSRSKGEVALPSQMK